MIGSHFFNVNFTFFWVFGTHQGSQQTIVGETTNTKHYMFDSLMPQRARACDTMLSLTCTMLSLTYTMLSLTCTWPIDLASVTVKLHWFVLACQVHD